MSQGFRVIRTIHGREPMLKSLTAEVRFADGQLYLDRCGRMLRQLTRKLPDWQVTGAGVDEGASLANPITNTRLQFGAEFAKLTLDLASSPDLITEGDVESFLDQAGDLLQWVTDELEVKEFLRLGLRQRIFFSSESRDDSERWIRELGLLTIKPELVSSFGATVEAAGFRVLFVAEDCRIQLSISGVERPAQVPVSDMAWNMRETTASKSQKDLLRRSLKANRAKQVNPAHYVELSIDSYLKEPAEIDIRAFLEKQAANCLDHFRRAVHADPTEGAKP